MAVTLGTHEFNPLVRLGLNLCYEIRTRVNGLSLDERRYRCDSRLKGRGTPLPDVIGEKMILNGLGFYAERNSTSFEFIINPVLRETETIGKVRDKKIYVFADPVDGTMKVAGLGNEGPIARLGNDGAWGCSIAFTDPTSKRLDDLLMGDFIYTALVDGNPPQFPHAPTNAITVYKRGMSSTYELVESSRFGLVKDSNVQLTTSSQKRLSQSIVSVDFFQGFDKKSAPNNSGSLATALYEGLANRNSGGAFDLTRTFGTAADVLRTLFGYHEHGMEPQGVARVVLNEHPANLIPAIAAIIGAGGSVLDFDGNDLRERSILAPRTHVIQAANPIIARTLLERVAEARARLSKTS